MEKVIAKFIGGPNNGLTEQIEMVDISGVIQPPPEYNFTTDYFIESSVNPVSTEVYVYKIAKPMNKKDKLVEYLFHTRIV